MPSAPGAFSGPNRPYALVTVAALIAVVGFVVVASPFSASSPESTTTTAPLVGQAAAGEIIFNSRCGLCHGPAGAGIPGLGPSLPDSVFAAGLTDAEYLAFLQVGRPSDDPANTTGIAMPARGGTPPLSDQELVDVIAYLRSITEPAG